MASPLELAPLALLPCLVLAWYLYRRRLARRPLSPPQATASRAESAATAHTAAVIPMPAPLAQPGETDAAALEESDATAIDVDAVDPKTEAQIYMSFGYLERAAEVLRAHIGEAGGDEETLATLCRLYLELRLPDEYCDILQRRQLDKAELEAAIRSGLRLSRNHLGLHVLADERLGLGPTAFAPATPAPPPAQAKAGAPARQAATRASAIPLPQGEPARLIAANDASLGALSVNETRVVRLFVPATRRIRLFLAAGDAENALPALREALRAQPDKPSLLIDLMQAHYLQRNVDAYARALWQFFAALGDNGAALRDKLLHYGLALGHHPAFAALAEARGRAELEAIGRRYSFCAQRPAAKADRWLVSRDTPDNAASAQSQDLLAEADSYLSFGQLDEALALLEAAILRTPHELALYPPLLELYERMGEPSRLAALQHALAGQAVGAPEEAKALLGTCARRLHPMDEVA